MGILIEVGALTGAYLIKEIACKIISRLGIDRIKKTIKPLQIKFKAIPERRKKLKLNLNLNLKQK